MTIKYWQFICILTIVIVTYAYHIHNHMLGCAQLSNFLTPWTLAHQAPLSTGFSRQEYWNGLPCPPPGDHPNPGIKPWFPTLQTDPLPSEPPGKPKNTGVGSLSLFPGIFLTQELNQSLLHCRWILHQLSYLGSPHNHIYTYNCILCGDIALIQRDRIT